MTEDVALQGPLAFALVVQFFDCLSSDFLKRLIPRPEHG